MRDELEKVLDLYENMPAEGQEHWKARSLPSVKFESEEERAEFVAALHERDKKPAESAAASLPGASQPAASFHPGQRVRVNLTGLRAGKVTFSENVEAVYATVQHQVSADPPTYHVQLLISFKGVQEIDVPADRMRPL